jgi:hypothetical protein
MSEPIYLDEDFKAQWKYAFKSSKSYTKMKSYFGRIYLAK